MRCPCGYRHAEIAHVCDKGKARRARQGVFFVKGVDGSYVSERMTDSAIALQYAKKVAARTVEHAGFQVVSVEEIGGEESLRVIRTLPPKKKPKWVR